jgi:DNA-binding cell septation regulator SpoVG
MAASAHDRAAKLRAILRTATSWAGHRSTPATSISAETSKSQPHRSRQMRGFCSIVLASGLVIKDRRVMNGSTRLAVALLLQRQVDGGGRACTGPGGKPIYCQLLEFTDKQTGNRFLTSAPQLINGAYPDAFADENLT